MKTIKIAGLIMLAIVTFSLIGLYQKKSQENLNLYVEQEVARKSSLSKYFRGQKFTYKGVMDIKKRYGVIEKSSITTSTHVFDFFDMTATLEATLEGVQKKTYPISDYSKRLTPTSTIHILEIGSAGLKEIRVNPEANTIGYYYDSGKVLVFKNLMRDVSIDLLN